MQHEATDARVLDDLRAELLGEHLVARPPRAELLARLLQRVEEGREVGVADAPRVLGPEAGQRAAGGGPALLGGQLLGREEPPQEVLASVWGARRLAEHRRGGGVPSEDVGARADQVGRIRRHALDELGEIGRRLARVVARGQRELDAREVEEVRALSGVEAQDPGQRVEHLCGRLDVPALLEPGVPGQADAGELGDLLATQAWRSASPVRGKPDVLRRHLRAAVPEEVRELRAALLGGWWCESHDRCPSCDATDRSAPSKACPTRHSPPSSQTTTSAGSDSAPCSSPARACSARRATATPRSPSCAARSSSASTTSTRRSTTGPTSSTRSSARPCIPTPRACAS